MEHHSNIVPWQQVCEKTGAILKIIPLNSLGEIDFPAYEQLLNSKTKLVALIHVSNVLGTINPVKKMIALAHEKTFLFYWMAHKPSGICQLICKTLIVIFMLFPRIRCMVQQVWVFYMVKKNI